jgi:fused signal recognition particle receptor
LSWFDRLKAGLAKTRNALTGGIRGAVADAQDPEEVLESVEEHLIMGDLGVRFADEMVEALRADVLAGNLGADAILERVQAKVRETFSKDYGGMRLDDASPAVVLMVGVNGVGKTTTCAKLAARFQAYGRTPILVAGDTFRAGAIEQLKVWGERIGVPVIAGKPGSDPSSLAYDACAKAKADGHDMVLIDTAGRLHTQFNLMKELEKIGKVVRKVVPGAPHETFLVLDATTGQNAVRQAEEFSKIVPVSGLVVTKLDGSAKGGCVVPVVGDHDVPVRFIGVGEAIEDLDNFDSTQFVEALFHD